MRNSYVPGLAAGMLKVTLPFEAPVVYRQLIGELSGAPDA
jgi:hypothetical protein